MIYTLPSSTKMLVWYTFTLKLKKKIFITSKTFIKQPFFSSISEWINTFLQYTPTPDTNCRIVNKKLRLFLFLFVSFFILWSNMHSSHKICRLMRRTKRVLRSGVRSQGFQNWGSIYSTAAREGSEWSDLCMKGVTVTWAMRICINPFDKLTCQFTI